MGNIPRPILIGVTVALAVVALAGFVLGFSQTLRHGAADEEETAIAASSASSLTIRDAAPLVEPVAIAPPKPKAAEAASDAAVDAAAVAPVVKPAPAPPVAVPSEAAPGAPAATPQPPPPKLGDLPPT